MNINELNFSLITIINYMINFFSYTFFMNRFFHLKYNRKLTNIVSTIMYIIVLVLTLPSYIDVFFYKPVIVISAIYILVFTLYSGSFIKKAICPFILLAVALIIEIPFDFLLIYGFNLSPYKVLHTPSFYLVQVLVNVLSFIIYYYIAKITNNTIHIYGKYKLLFFLMTIQTFTIIISISQSLVVVNEPSKKESAKTFLLIIIIAIMIIDFIIFYLIRKFNRSAKLELALQKIQVEYDKSLESYQQVNDDEYIRCLRHDILNFLQHKKINEGQNETK